MKDSQNSIPTMVRQKTTKTRVGKIKDTQYTEKDYRILLSVPLDDSIVATFCTREISVYESYFVLKTGWISDASE